MDQDPISTESGPAPTVAPTPGDAPTGATSVAPEAPGPTCVPPAAGTGIPARRPDGRKRRPYTKRPNVKITPMLEERVGAMLAAGIPKTDIAESLDMNRATVDTISKRPTAQVTIQAVREAMRRKSVEKAEALTEAAYEFLGQTIQAKDAKGFDAVSRGIASMERAASSASGEARKVESTVTERTVDAAQEAKDLLAMFLQPSGRPN